MDKVILRGDLSLGQVGYQSTQPSELGGSRDGGQGSWLSHTRNYGFEADRFQGWPLMRPDTNVWKQVQLVKPSHRQWWQVQRRQRWQFAALGKGNWASSGHTEDSLRPRASLTTWVGKTSAPGVAEEMLPVKNSWRLWRTKACCRGKFQAGGWGLGFHFLVPEQFREGETGLCHTHFLPDLGYSEQRSEGLLVLKMEGTGWGKRDEAKLDSEKFCQSCNGPVSPPFFKVQKVYVWWYTCMFQSSQQVFFSVQYNKQSGWAIFLVHQIYWN